jgi:hypothetical protein
MYSYRNFMPGRSSDTRNVIKNSGKDKICVCGYDTYNKNLPQANSTNVSNKMRISQQIQSTVGGSIQYGMYSLANVPTINYLGRTEGQYGGSGRPPSNFLVGRPSFHY